MTTYDRMSDGYEPRFDIDLAVGKQGEMWVHHVIDAIQRGSSVEIKTDEMASMTGRIYLETACLYGSEYRHSALSTTPCELWAHVLAGDVVVIAPTWRYQYAAKKAWKKPGLRKHMRRGSHPTYGLLVPLRNLLEWLMEAPAVAEPIKVVPKRNIFGEDCRP